MALDDYAVGDLEEAYLLMTDGDGTGCTAAWSRCSRYVKLRVTTPCTSP